MCVCVCVCVCACLCEYVCAGGANGGVGLTSQGKERDSVIGR